MYRKKSSSLRSENMLTMPRAHCALHGRHPAPFPLPERSVSLEVRLIHGCIVTAGFFIITCTTPPPPVIRQCPEPLWKKYSRFDAYQVKEETARLEALLAAGVATSPDSSGETDSTDTAAAKKLSALEIKRRLFELSIHRANPDYNVDKIFDYVSFLYQHGGPDSLRYLNWGRVVREQKALVRTRDSIAAAVSAISEADAKASRSVEHLKKEIKRVLKQCDSLTAVITDQQEMIAKLQKLDVMMERQRRKIQ
ncbi:MAG: hypothetical protein JXA18_16810 [Chitinispirillaceae bacterium]|nr:hypothetical protein [Chitinispirillaceae bacterium]